MLDIRKRLFIVVGVVALLLIVVVLFLLIGRKPMNQERGTPVSGGEESQDQPSTNPGSGQNIGTVPISPDGGSTLPAAPAAPAEDAGERYVRQLSRIFVERFGSYSNQNNNSHIANVAPLITDRVARYVATQTIEQSTQYKGKTTNVISSSVDTYDGAKATVLIGVQEVTQDQNGSQTTYRSGNVELLNINGEWKVDGLFWDET